MLLHSAQGRLLPWLALLCSGLCCSTLPVHAQGYAATHRGARIEQVVDAAHADLRWAPPSAIATGDRLSALELNATANVSGAFVYQPAEGTVLPVGKNLVAVRFVPEDHNFAEVQKTAEIEVLPANGASFAVDLDAGVPPAVVQAGNFSRSALQVRITPSGVLNQAVHLSCEASPGVLCTFSPQDLRTGAIPVQVALTVHVPAFLLFRAHAAMLLPLAAMFPLCRRRRLAWGLAAALLLAVSVCTGCGMSRPLHVAVVASTSTETRTIPLSLQQLGLVER